MINLFACGNPIMSNDLRFLFTGIALAALAQGVSVGQDQLRTQRPGADPKSTSQRDTGAFGVTKDVHQTVAGQAHSAAGGLTRVDGVRAAFTPKYLAIRERLLKEFEHHGQIAESADGTLRSFSDQTLYLGFALLTFAGEARILHQSGHDARPSEHVLHRLLLAFEALDKDAERERYHTSVPGFFLRDYMTEWPGFQVHSGFLDSASKLGEADMSLDQVVSLMMGWWAVSHWSTDAGNRNLAKSQAERVLGFLCNERFMIDRPGTHTSVSRGDDARARPVFSVTSASRSPARTITAVERSGSSTTTGATPAAERARSTSPTRICSARRATAAGTAKLS